MDFILSLLPTEMRELLRLTEALCAGPVGALDRAAGETAVVDRALLRQLAESGLLDLTVPGAYATGRLAPPAPPRGLPRPAPASMSLRAYCLVRETLARHCPAAELLFTMQGLGSGPISFFGTEAQRRAYLPRVAAGELVAAFALTEPHTGS